MRRSKLPAILAVGSMILPCNPSFAAARLYESKDYAIRLKAPAGRAVCPGLSWTHVHGFSYNITPPWDCRKNTENTRVSLVGIWADFNAVPWSFRQYQRLTCKGKKITLPADQLAQLNFNGRKTTHCVVTDKGEISVYAMTEQGYDKDMHASCIPYDAYLITRAARLQKDLPAFATFLKNLTFTRSGC